jgi:CheY-like chemotaxis protein
MSKKILLLDDEEDIRETLKRNLERVGYAVTAVGDGKQGLRAAQAQLYDLIVTDVAMPVMDGFRFFKEIREWPAYAKVPVIVMTAHASMEDSFRVFGVAEFFAKPVELDVVIQSINGLLNPTHKPLECRNILVCGSNMDVVGSMVQLLNDHGQKATAAHEEIEFFVKALTDPPDLILIDVLLPKLMAHEVIASLRAFSRFSSLKILAYTHFSEKELTSVNAVEQLKASKNKCLESGADEYIGRFSKVTFMETIREFYRKP